MFNSSLRRAARTCPNTTVVARHTPTTSSKTSATFSTRCHQRRYSSSKPPVPPNNGSAAIPASSVKQVGSPRSTDKRPGAESRLSKRKSAKSEKIEQTKQQELRGNEWTLSLPSVPSTQHLGPKDVYVASFFSTHRPMSISGPVPPETQIEDIEKIFQSRQRKSKRVNPAEVIYTLNNAVQTFDEHVQNSQDPKSRHKSELLRILDQDNTNSQVHHLDGQPRGPSNIKLVIEDLAKRFKPFNTPPPPVPVPEVDFNAQHRIAASESEANEEMQAQQLEAEVEAQHKISHRRSLASKKSTSLHSGSFFTPHGAPLSEPTTTPHNLPVRQLRRRVYVDPVRGTRSLIYQLISVKRQRRLKMKKHKYKKLMRKTRNLRRRQDKL